MAVMTAAIASAITTWPWSMISAFAAVIALGVLIHINFVRPNVRRRRLKKPVKAVFLIPSKIQRDCDFVLQDERTHLVKSIIVPPNHDIIIDLRFEPRMFFTTSEVAIGCDGDISKIPYVTEYHNEFIKQGEGKIVVPGPGNRHYVDWHIFYHYKETVKH